MSETQTDRINIPKIEILSGLDHNSPTYVDIIDSALFELGRLLVISHSDDFSRKISAQESLLERIRAIPGIMVEELQDVKIGDVHQTDIRMTATGREAVRKLEDVQRDFEREYRRKSEALEDHITALERAHEDFAWAATNLTSIFPIVEPNYSRERVKFFYSRGNVVFESNLDGGNGKLAKEAPSRDVSLKDLDDENFYKVLASDPELSSNIYRVKNPSRNIPVRVVFAKAAHLYGVAYKSYQQSEKLRKDQELAKMSPAQRVLYRLRELLK